MPRVSYLTYRLRDVVAVSYDRAPPIQWQDELGVFRLERGMLRVNLQKDFVSFEEAQRAVESVLSAWETSAALHRGPGEFRFVGAGGAMERTRREIEEGENGGYLNVLLASDTLHATATVDDHIDRATYPAPPATFGNSPDVVELVGRWNQARQKREPSLSAANYILTRVEQLRGGGSRDAASRALNLHKDVLRKMGELCATRGDAMTARKASASLTPLSSREQQWLDRAIPAVIGRVADPRPLETLPMITMADLPPL